MITVYTASAPRALLLTVQRPCCLPAAFPGVKPPPGAVNPYDTGKVNSKVIKYLPTDPASTESYYISTASSFVLPASSPAASSPAPKPSPPAAPSSSAAASQQSADPASSASSSTSAYAYAWLDSPQSGFFDASWLAEVYPNSAGQGLDGSNALCAKLDTSGALALRSKDLGKFAGKRSLQFYVKTDQGVPDIHINLAGAKVRAGAAPTALAQRARLRAGLLAPPLLPLTRARSLVACRPLVHAGLVPPRRPDGPAEHWHLWRLRPLRHLPAQLQQRQLAELPDRLRWLRWQRLFRRQHHRVQELQELEAVGVRGQRHAVLLASHGC